MTLYVLDAECLAMLPKRIWPNYRTQVLDAVTDAVFDRQAGFPPEVTKEARRLADDEDKSWVHALGAAVRMPDIAYEYVMQAMAGCPGFYDYETGWTSTEPSGIYVLAAALALSGSGSAAVVTDETAPLPERECLAWACSKLGLPTMTLDMFVGQLPGCSGSMVR